MKKTLIIFAALLIAVISLSSCSKVNTGYKDGVYSAQSAEFPASGWKELVEITVEDGKLIKIDWDGIYKDDSVPIRKKQYSKSGLYGMMAAGACAEWYDQAIATEQFVLKNGVDALSINQDGYTDAISGCTIHISEFEELLRECLAQAKK